MFVYRMFFFYLIGINNLYIVILKFLLVFLLEIYLLLVIVSFNIYSIWKEDC